MSAGTHRRGFGDTPDTVYEQEGRLYMVFICSYEYSFVMRSRQLNTAEKVDLDELIMFRLGIARIGAVETQLQLVQG